MENRSTKNLIDNGAGRKSHPLQLFYNSSFKTAVLICVMIVCIMLLAIFISLFIAAQPSLRKFGVLFFGTSTWDPLGGQFGALPFMLGTLLTSIIALIVCIPFSLSVSLILGEYFHSGPVATILNSAMELLAGIPSIIFGMWGLFVLVPIIRGFEASIGVTPLGVGIFAAAILLSVMIIPFAASISREVIGMVPNDLKEAAYSLGATRFEVIRKVVIPYAGSGIIAGILLSFGRALGETMAVTMVIGNSYFMPTNIFGPGHTIASIIANEFTEAADPMYLSALIEMGLVLFIITIVFGIAGRYIITKASVKD
ncbi:MAG: phosphate ABC transporter permease subunit PstC [Brevinematales bacterium]